MPERIGDTNQVKLFEGESIVATNGNQMDGPQVVRVQEYPDFDLVSLQGIDTQNRDVKMEVAVEGGTIEAFCAMNFT